MKAGVILEKIDGQALTPDMDYAALLNGCQGRKILVSFRDPQSGKSWDEVVKPISNGAMSGLLYERWVKQRAADVENGRRAVWVMCTLNQWATTVSVPLFGHSRQIQ